MNYQIVDLTTYPRRDTYLHFINRRQCTYSLTIKINVEKVYRKSREMSIGFYPLFMAIVTKAVNSFPFSRMDISDKNELIIYDYVMPGYTLFHEDDETYSCMYTDYLDDLFAYAMAMDADIKRVKDDHHFVLREQPLNIYPVSTLPWIAYDNLTIKVTAEHMSLLPMITWGKFHREDFMMPLSLEINHAVMDGYHTHLLIEKIKELIGEM